MFTIIFLLMPFIFFLYPRFMKRPNHHRAVMRYINQDFPDDYIYAAVYQYDYQDRINKTLFRLARLLGRQVATEELAAKT
ncbi:MAG: hypothetical protein B7Z59_11145 [Acidiphilium sp. 37-67-22]|nr:MAG: hypothetical protein B7Z59_11145 [Acidiphilium sp. 37-67-22]